MDVRCPRRSSSTSPGQWAVFGVMGPKSRDGRGCGHRRGSFQRRVSLRCGPRHRDRLRDRPCGAGSRTWASSAGSCTCPPTRRATRSTGSWRWAATTACGLPACTRSTRAESRRSSSISDTTSPTSTPRWRPACGGCAGWTNPRRSSGTTRLPASSIRTGRSRSGCSSSCSPTRSRCCSATSRCCVTASRSATSRPATTDTRWAGA